MIFRHPRKKSGRLFCLVFSDFSGACQRASDIFHSDRIEGRGPDCCQHAVDWLCALCL